MNWLGSGSCEDDERAASGALMKTGGPPPLTESFEDDEAGDDPSCLYFNLLCQLIAVPSPPPVLHPPLHRGRQVSQITPPHPRPFEPRLPRSPHLIFASSSTCPLTFIQRETILLRPSNHPSPMRTRPCLALCRVAHHLKAIMFVPQFTTAAGLSVTRDSTQQRQTPAPPSFSPPRYHDARELVSSIPRAKGMGQEEEGWGWGETEEFVWRRWDGIDASSLASTSALPSLTGCRKHGGAGEAVAVDLSPDEIDEGRAVWYGRTPSKLFLAFAIPPCRPLVPISSILPIRLSALHASLPPSFLADSESTILSRHPFEYRVLCARYCSDALLIPIFVFVSSRPKSTTYRLVAVLPTPCFRH
ncbi:hypothetical protein R3P38DRAFT_3267811 [Favolaschia claudopus]|uniref:Uncharacterized protein n=1 Tax=Favolaschia claudopus TaxID=2862362 RepID=A0AAW0BMR1_9AGAR